MFQAYLAKAAATSPIVAAALKWAESNVVSAAVLGFLGLVLFLALSYDYCKRFPLRRIPGPVGVPLFGHVLYMVGTPWLTLHRFAKRFGGIYLIRFWTRPFVVLSDPDHVKHVFKDEKAKYVKDQWSYEYFRDVLGYGLVTSEGSVWKSRRAMMSPAFHYAALERLNAVFEAAADRLTRQLEDACTKPLPANTTREVVLQTALENLDLASGQTLTRSDITNIPLGKSQAVTELCSHFRKVTLEVISQVALGFDPSQASVFPDLFEAVLDELNDRPYKPWRQFLPWVESPHRKNVSKLNAIVIEMIRSRRQLMASNPSLFASSASDEASAAAASSGKFLTASADNNAGAAFGQVDGGGGAGSSSSSSAEDGNDINSGAGGVSLGKVMFKDGKGDMLDMMLQLEHEAVKKEGEKARFTERQLMDELKTQLLAGHETTSMLLTWTCYALVKYPHIYQKCQEEVDAVLGTDVSTKPAFDQFRSLRYLEWTMKEAMRVFSLVPIMNRECIEEDEIGGYKITPGSGVIINVWSLHQSPKHWGADVAEFRPERFSPEETKARHPWCYMPFSLGERNCIGQNLAMMEAKVVLGSLLRRFKLEIPSGTLAASKEGMGIDSYILPVRPAERLNVVVTMRS